MAIQGKSHPINFNFDKIIAELKKMKAEAEAEIAKQEAEKDKQEEKTAEKNNEE